MNKFARVSESLRRLLAIASLAIMASAPVAAPLAALADAPYAPVTAQFAGNGASLVTKCPGDSSAVVFADNSGSLVGTITVTTAADATGAGAGQTYHSPYFATAGAGSTTFANTLTAFPGSIYVTLGSDSYVKAAVTAFTSGSSYVTIVCSSAVARAPVSGGGGSGTVTQVNSGTGLTGGPITGSGTLSLVTPVSVANGGTGTATPSLTPSGCLSVGGTWANQTITGLSNCVSNLEGTTGNTNVAVGTVANTYQQLGANVSVTTGVSNGTQGKWLVEVEEALSSSDAVIAAGGAYGCFASASTYTLIDNTSDGASTCFTALTNSVAGTTKFAGSASAIQGSQAFAKALVYVANSTTFTVSCYVASTGTVSNTVYGYCHVKATPV